MELEQSQRLFDGDVPFLTGQLDIDISIKDISNLVYVRLGTDQYPSEDQDR